MTSQKTNFVNTNLEYELARSTGSSYNPQTGAQVADAVRHSLVTVLMIEEQEIFPETKPIEDLGAESLDGLNLSFAIENILGIKLSEYGNLLITEEDKPQTVLGLAKLVYHEKIK